MARNLQPRSQTDDRDGGSAGVRRVRRASSGVAGIVRKPVEKAYGAKARYGETKYERERRQAREAG